MIDRQPALVVKWSILLVLKVYVIYCMKLDNKNNPIIQNILKKLALFATYWHLCYYYGFTI